MSGWDFARACLGGAMFNGLLMGACGVPIRFQWAEMLAGALLVAVCLAPELLRKATPKP